MKNDDLNDSNIPSLVNAQSKLSGKEYSDSLLKEREKRLNHENNEIREKSYYHHNYMKNL